MASLLIKTGPRKGKILALSKEKTSLGRDPRCDIVLDEHLVVADPTSSDLANAISRQHAVIMRRGAEYVIADGDGRDHPSKNQTYVNDHRVPDPPATHPLRHGDQIRLTRFTCTFQLDASEIGEGEDSSISVDSSLGTTNSVIMLSAQPAEQLQVILQISNELSHALDLADLLPRLLDHLLELFPQAERAFVLLSDEPDALPTVRAFKFRQGVENLDCRVSFSIIRRCMEKVEAILGNHPHEQFPDSESLNSLPLRSLLCAPLWSQDGRALGAIQLDSSGPGTRFAEPDLQLLLGVAGQASVAVVNARMHRAALVRQRREQDMTVAREVQLALLPQTLPTVPGFAFDARYQAAQEVGGDLYDFVPLPGGRLAVLVGDVAGKGVPAALVMAKFSVEARVCLETAPDLGVAVSRLNAQMVRARLGERFVTLAVVILDPAARTLTVVNAGHPSPLVCRGQNRIVEEASPRSVSGSPLGLFAGEAYTAREIAFAPGDGLILFSDGVTEAMNAQGEMFRKTRVRSTLAVGAMAPHEVGKRLIEAVKTHADGQEQSDDIVLVCVGRTG
jgi:sigma-B regulation protein RsbU (phosphoserine phosphatase)